MAERTNDVSEGISEPGHFFYLNTVDQTSITSYFSVNLNLIYYFLLPLKFSSPKTLFARQNIKKKIR
jgi:hypothetical protein